MKLLKEKLWTDPIKEAGWQVNLQVSGQVRVQVNWQVFWQVYRLGFWPGYRHLEGELNETTEGKIVD